MRRHVLLKLRPSEALLAILLALSQALRVPAVCPSPCSCSRSHREVDCSRRGLRQLPDGLQHNMLSLDLSHNRFHDLDGRLTPYTHLRFLDLSHNRLGRVPAGLPRSLWRLSASSNRLQLLDKNDTVYQWNLRALDLSDNRLERATFINNTLTNMCALNLSRNHFWTLPTNMPARLETVDLSHNLLVKVLPGSLDRLVRLTHFYLHANRFPALPSGALDQLTSLRVVTLGSNPWACHLSADISYLLSWTQRTPARVLGCPCHTQPVCGRVRPGRTGGWHFASYNHPPLAASTEDLSSMPPEDGVTGWWFSSSSSSSSSSSPHVPKETWHRPSTATPTDTHLTINHLSESTKEADSVHATLSPSSDTSLIPHTAVGADMTLATDRFFTTESPSVQTRKTTTLRTRSVRRQNQSFPSSSGGGGGGGGPAPCSSLPLLHNLGLLSLILQQVVL